jgi:hypothetical protein
VCHHCGKLRLTRGKGGVPQSVLTLGKGLPLKTAGAGGRYPHELCGRTVL